MQTTKYQMDRIGIKQAVTFISFIHYECIKTEPGHSISYNEIACAPSEDSAQPAYPCSLIRVFAKDLRRLQADSEDSDQTARMRRLIWVFDGHTCNLVGNAVPRLNV